MGDISEMRGLIVVFCIMAVAITLIALMPPEFYIGSATSPSTSSVSPSGIIAWNSTYTLNFTGASSNYEFDLNGYHFDVSGVIDPYTWEGGLSMSTYENWWIFYWNYDYFKWYINNTEVSYTPSSASTRIKLSTIDANPINTAYTCKNSKTMITTTFAYNTTTYTKFSDAYNANDAAMIFNMDWNERNTSIGALNLISMLFTASLPNVDPTISLLISFPIWACTGYLVFIFVLRIIGAVFGGGGA